MLQFEPSVNLRERLAEPLAGHRRLAEDRNIYISGGNAFPAQDLPDRSRDPGAAVPALPNRRVSGYAVVNERTLVFDRLSELQKLEASPPTPRMIDANAPGQVYVQGNSAAVKQLLGELLNSTGYLPFAPLVSDTREYRGTADLRNPLELRLTVDCASDEAATNVSKTLDALLTLGRNVLRQQQEIVTQGVARISQQEAALMRQWLPIGNEVLADRNVSIMQAGHTVSLTLSARVDFAGSIRELAPLIAAERARARRNQSSNNLKQIALGLLNFESQRRQLPPAVLLGPVGVTTHSWRVAILPYIGHQQLYERYHLNEPWDSPHNLSLLKEMPDTYRHPEDDAASTNASFFVLTGPDTVFSGGIGGANSRRDRWDVEHLPCRRSQT